MTRVPVLGVRRWRRVGGVVGMVSRRRVDIHERRLSNEKSAARLLSLTFDDRETAATNRSARWLKRNHVEENSLDHLLRSDEWLQLRDWSALQAQGGRSQQVLAGVGGCCQGTSSKVEVVLLWFDGRQMIVFPFVNLQFHQAFLPCLFQASSHIRRHPDGYAGDETFLH